MTAPFIIPDFTGITHGRKPPYGQIRLNRNHPLAKGLVGCWLMNEGGGNTVYDLSGKDNNLDTFVNTPEWDSDGINFDLASSEYVSGTDKGSLSPAGDELTIFAIVTPARTTFTEDGTIFWRTRTTSQTLLYGLRIDSILNRYEFLNYTSSATTITGNTPITTKKTSVAGVYDGSNIHLYVNSIVDATPVSKTGNFPSPSHAAISVGAKTSNEFYFDGIVHVLFIFERALTPSEIASLHVNPYQTFEPVIPLPIVAGISEEIVYLDFISQVIEVF